MSCPYCKSDVGDCVHHLLSVEMGYEGGACGGALYELFNARLKQVRRSMKEVESEESVDALDKCLAEVAELAGDGRREIEGGLASGAFEDFYCPTEAEVDRLIESYATRYGLKY